MEPAAMAKKGKSSVNTKNVLKNLAKEGVAPLSYQDKLMVHEQTKISDATQEMLNTPLTKQIKPAYKGYLQMILSLIRSGEIDLYRPDTFINEKEYNALPPAGKAAVDKTLLNLADMTREVARLNELKIEDSYQMENLVDNIWFTKEKIEQIHGDVYKI